MKVAYRIILRTFLCTAMLLGVGTFALAQEPTGQQAAPDNTKVNERDRSTAEPTADQQKDNRSDRDITTARQRSARKTAPLASLPSRPQGLFHLRALPQAIRAHLCSAHRGLLKAFAGDRNLAPDKRCQLDRLYQRLTDDLDALLSAVGLKTAA